MNSSFFAFKYSTQSPSVLMTLHLPSWEEAAEFMSRIATPTFFTS